MAINTSELYTDTAASSGQHDMCNRQTQCLYNVSWYLVITQPGSGLLSVANVILRWNDGVTSRTLTSSGLSLLSSGYLTGNAVIYVPSGNYPTWEVTMSSLLGSPEYSFRYQYDSTDQLN